MVDRNEVIVIEVDSYDYDTFFKLNSCCFIEAPIWNVDYNDWFESAQPFNEGAACDVENIGIRLAKCFCHPTLAKLHRDDVIKYRDAGAATLSDVKLTAS